MKVSVIIPCYNGKEYVARCIESILNQTREPDEIIFVDDGSTDGSAEVATKYPVKLVRHERNEGLAQARNTGIRVAKCDIISFIDVDCEANPNFIDFTLEDFEDSFVAGVGGQEVPRVMSASDRWYRQSWGEKKLVNPPFLYGLCSSFRKKILQKVGLFDVFFKSNGEDVDISIRLKRYGFRLIYDPQIKVYHMKRRNLKSDFDYIYRACYYGRIAQIKNKAFEDSGVRRHLLRHLFNRFNRFKLVRRVRDVSLLSAFTITEITALIRAFIDWETKIKYCERKDVSGNSAIGSKEDNFGYLLLLDKEKRRDRAVRTER